MEERNKEGKSIPNLDFLGRINTLWCETMSKTELDGQVGNRPLSTIDEESQIHDFSSSSQGSYLDIHGQQRRETKQPHTRQIEANELFNKTEMYDVNNSIYPGSRSSNVFTTDVASEAENEARLLKRWASDDAQGMVEDNVDFQNTFKENENSNKVQNSDKKEKLHQYASPKTASPSRSKTNTIIQTETNTRETSDFQTCDNNFSHFESRLKALRARNQNLTLDSPPNSKNWHVYLPEFSPPHISTDDLLTKVSDKLHHSTVGASAYESSATNIETSDMWRTSSRQRKAMVDEAVTNSLKSKNATENDTERNKEIHGQLCKCVKCLLKQLTEVLNKSPKIDRNQGSGILSTQESSDLNDSVKKGKELKTDNESTEFVSGTSLDLKRFNGSLKLTTKPNSSVFLETVESSKGNTFEETNERGISNQSEFQTSKTHEGSIRHRQKKNNTTHRKLSAVKKSGNIDHMSIPITNLTKKTECPDHINNDAHLRKNGGPLTVFIDQEEARSGMLYIERVSGDSDNGMERLVLTLLSDTEQTNNSRGNLSEEQLQKTDKYNMSNISESNTESTAYSDETSVDPKHYSKLSRLRASPPKTSDTELESKSKQIDGLPSKIKNNNEKQSLLRRLSHQKPFDANHQQTNYTNTQQNNVPKTFDYESTHSAPLTRTPSQINVVQPEKTDNFHAFSSTYQKWKNANLVHNSFQRQENEEKYEQNPEINYLLEDVLLRKYDDAQQKGLLDEKYKQDFVINNQKRNVTFSKYDDVDFADRVLTDPKTRWNFRDSRHQPLNFSLGYRLDSFSKDSPTLPHTKYKSNSFNSNLKFEPNLFNFDSINESKRRPHTSFQSIDQSRHLLSSLFINNRFMPGISRGYHRISPTTGTAYRTMPSFRSQRYGHPLGLSRLS